MAAKNSPGKQLDSFIAKYTPDVAAIARAAIAKMRARLPGAVELVYDNYNALAVGFGPSERTSEAVFSITLFPRWVSLFFLHGANLRDSQHVLRGKGTRARHIVLTGAGDLALPAVEALIAEALVVAPKPFDRKRRRLIIKSISAKQRPRRPAEAGR
jgi:hypothetical protein